VTTTPSTLAPTAGPSTASADAPSTTPPSSAPEQTSQAAVPVTTAGVHGVALGDSVMVGATSALHQALPGLDVQAKESRAFVRGLDIARGLQAQGALGDIAVVHLGTNGPFPAGQFDAMMQTLASCRRVVWVTVHEPRSWASQVNGVIRSGVARFGDRAVLADWDTAGDGHPEYFYGDGIHLRPAGAAAYAALIAGAVQR
jgi:hypothetical protein